MFTDYTEDRSLKRDLVLIGYARQRKRLDCIVEESMAMRVSILFVDSLQRQNACLRYGSAASQCLATSRK
jgi:hypothetical protein